MNESILTNIKNATKILLEKKKYTKIKKIPTLEETIQSIVKATNPALKAHATRRLKAYSIYQSKRINSTPNRVIAGVCAAATKRMRFVIGRSK